MMHRRDFLGLSAAALASESTLFAADAEIQITPRESAPEISPHLYGHFIEHLGAVVYVGVWVGRNSRIPNVNGIRKQFLDDMKRVAAPNIRWPGGCFADGYHWRDGIGNASKRPRTYNYWQATMPAGLDETETNEFGIHEFMDLCRLTGASPYLAANMGSASPQEFHEWVQYCNAPAGTVSLAAERGANGDPEPFGVRWWGVGNESWGCGGDMTPQEYATRYRQYVTQFPAYAPAPTLVAVGPRGHSKDMDLGWTKGFFEAMQGHRSAVGGLSMHYYTDFRNSPEKVATFDARGWYDVLREGLRTETVIEQHWAAMGRYDPQHRTKLVVDEWGVWYHPGEETAPAHILSQPLTLRDALHTAITFDIFNRHADKVAMANVAQTINCIHSLFLSQGDRYTRTPVFYVFDMYRKHHSARLAAMEIRCHEWKVPSRNSPGTMPGLSGSASGKDKTLTVTITNPSLDSPVSAQIRVSGSSLLEGRATVLTHPDMTARNSFDRPDEVKTVQMPVAMSGGTVGFVFAPRSVTLLELRMA